MPAPGHAKRNRDGDARATTTPATTARGADVCLAPHREALLLPSSAVPRRTDDTAAAPALGHDDVRRRLANELTIVHISDTHDVAYRNVPPGDILVHSGDMVNTGSAEEYSAFRAWLHAQPHLYKILVPGNHEYGIDGVSAADMRRLLVTGDGLLDTVTAASAARTFVLVDASVVIRGVRFAGTPWNNSSSPPHAFVLDEAPRGAKFSMIPIATDVLITHVPPFNVLDLRHKLGKGTEPCGACDGTLHVDHFHWGCAALRARVAELRPALHLFGHVHTTTGVRRVAWDNVAAAAGGGGDDVRAAATVFSNAAMKDNRRPCVVNVVVPEGRDCAETWRAPIGFCAC